MGEIILRLLTNSLVDICLAALVFLLLSAAVFLRLLPRLLDWLRVALRWFLLISFRFYYLILVRLAPAFRQFPGIELMKLPSRLFACCLLSLVFGLFFLLLIQGTIGGVVVALFLIHGLVISLVWNDFLPPKGLRLGEKID